MMFVKTIIALSLAILVVAAPRPQLDALAGDLAADTGAAIDRAGYVVAPAPPPTGNGNGNNRGNGNNNGNGNGGNGNGNGNTNGNGNGNGRRRA